MSRPLRAMLTLTAVALMPVACGPAESVSVFPAEHQAAIRDSVTTFLGEYSALVQAGAWEELLELYSDADDFVWIEDGRVAYRSHEEIGQAFENLRAMNAEVRTSWVDPRVSALAPGVAALSTGLSQEFAMPSGSFGFEGAISATLVHTADGWRFLRGHTSTVRPDGER